MDKKPVPVTRKVANGLETVRSSGVTNMLDSDAVARYAQMYGYFETAQWIRENRKRYAELVFNGLEVVDVTNG